MTIKYNISKPIWNERAVGIASHRLVTGATMDVTITYEDSDGNLVYPGKYRMACSKMKKYKTQKLANGIVLHIIPIADFELGADDDTTRET